MTINEEKVIIAEADRQETQKLEQLCRRGPVLHSAPTENDSMVGSIRRLTGDCFEPVVSTDKTLRQCAAEHNAQVVQIIGRETETVSPRNHFWLSFAAGALAAGSAWSAGVGRSIGSNSMATTASLASIRMQETSLAEAQAAQYDGGESTQRTTALDLQFWQCPASRATPKPGELVAVWPHSFADWNLKIVKDGKVVTTARDGYAGLSDLVSAYPPAVEHSKQAQALASSAVSSQYVNIIAALVFIAATGSGTAGYFLHKPLVLWPSVGVMAVSLPFTMVSSAANLGRKSASEAMDAIDLYDDNYIRRDQLVVTPVTDGQ